MNIWRRIGRWGDRRLLKSRPEFQLFPSDAERAEAIERLDTSLEESRGFWIAVAAVVLLAVAATFGLQHVADLVVPGRPGWTRIVVNVLGFGIGWAGVVWVWRRGVVGRLRAELLDLDVPVCLRCGYGLAGTTGPRCPECGWTLSRRVAALRDPP